MTQDNISTTSTPNQEQNEQKTSYAVRPHHRQKRLTFSEHDNMFKVRNYLNIVFMLLAVIGLILYYSMNDHTLAIVILLAGVVLKIVEVCIRLFHR